MTKSSTPILYTITSNDLSGHLFDVSLNIAQPAPEGQKVGLPTWIPGSYMVREFARNIIALSAFCNGKKIVAKKIDKQTWQLAPCNGPVQIVYQVYAWDLSVRAAHLDQSHGFFNGTSVFLQVFGQEHEAHVVDIQKPSAAECKTWRVATAMKELKAKRYGFGTYQVANYDELIDHPVEMGDFQMASFEAHGVPHDIVFTGLIPNLDLARMQEDFKKICESQIAFFEPRSKKAPMDRYVFMTMVIGDGFGGLEHRASSALLCKRTDLPCKNGHINLEDYQAFLGLVSHEYFHTWNVKRIKPAVFAEYDLRQENYSSLLWLFEGFTSYYDDLFLLRAGLIDEKAYFSLVTKTINGVVRGAGRLKQSVAESSFDAWTKYYRQDENAPNAIVSYYTKGSLVALGLDLMIRSETSGEKSLDDVMRALWQLFGRDFYSKLLLGKQSGLGENEIVSIIENATGVNTKRFMDKHVRGTEDVPLTKLFAEFDIALTDKRAQQIASMGVRTSKDGSLCKLANVFSGKAAHLAGLSGGDHLVAINGMRVTAQDGADQLKRALAPYSVGESLTVHAFRRDELLTVQVKLQSNDVPNYQVELNDKSKTVLFSKRPSAVKSSTTKVSASKARSNKAKNK
jgi:predicted metalloprotease with PDZ domain